MTFPEATELAVFAKELFPTMTGAQGAILRDLFVPFPDSKYARDLLKRLATETTLLPTPMIRSELQLELRRRGATAEDYARQQDRLQDANAVRTREQLDEFIAGFSDDDLEAMKPDALKILAGRLNGYAMEFVKKRHPRQSVLLKQAIYEMVKPVRA